MANGPVRPMQPVRPLACRTRPDEGIPAAPCSLRHMPFARGALASHRPDAVCQLAASSPIAFATGLRPVGSDIFGLNPRWSLGFGRPGRRASWHTAKKPLTGKAHVSATR
uniref:Uncharacterized protein n=1 Tax=Oryza meridionalis TaxID=40149 RepID=A0A0E0D2M7_9ORYZ